MKIATAMVWIACASAAFAQGSGVTDAVRAARAVSNKAISARDLTAYTATITPDFVITTGSGKSYTRTEFLVEWGKLFADKKWQGCDRIVDAIQLSTNQPAAAERGHFVCALEQPDGREVYTGTYLAMWRKDGGVWRTRSELFVTLSCTGSDVCKAPKL
jgi:ketosteroid isomerase-like protein